MMTDTAIGEIPENFDFPGDIAEEQYIQVTYESVHANSPQTIAGEIKNVLVSEGIIGTSLEGYMVVEIRFMPHDGTNSDREWHTAPRKLSVTMGDGRVQWTVLHSRNDARWNRLNESGTNPKFTILPV